MKTQRNSPPAFKTTISAGAAALAASLVLPVLVFPISAGAADWSDTSLSLRYGTSFAEPYINNADGSRLDIKKTIAAITHISGYKYGTNFVNLDLLQSDRSDPGDGKPGNSGAQEAYLVYRHMLDIGKVAGSEFKFGPVRGLGLTAGFDLNTKNDGYGSRKRMFVVGPTLMIDVPGFLNISALLLDESNAPNGVANRYHYRNHGAIEADWGIPVSSLPLSFNGYALYIGSMGDNEFGGATAPETHVDAALMWDVGQALNGPKHTFLLGLEYEFWRNKFGNPVPAAGAGAKASTPMIRGEYHF